MSEDKYDDIYELIKHEIGLSREEFEDMVEEVFVKNGGLISRRGAAIVVAKKLGIDTMDILYPPIVGRLIEVGPVRTAKSPSGETPFVMFSVVNEKQRIQGVAFGHHHVNLLRSSEDKPILIRGYGKARLEKYSAIKVTEKTKIEVLDESILPPIEKLAPAWAPSLVFIKDNKGAWLVRAVVLDQTTMEYTACPLCGKAVEMVDDKWICPEHGPIEMPKYEKIWRFILSDRSGVMTAVYFREPPHTSLINRLVTLKGYYREDELYIMRFYSVSEETVIKE